MVRFSWVRRAVFRMDHPQVRWSLQLMTQDGWNAEQVQEDYKGVGALPLNRGECASFHEYPCLYLHVLLCLLDGNGTLTSAVFTARPACCRTGAGTTPQSATGRQSFATHAVARLRARSVARYPCG